MHSLLGESLQSHSVYIRTVCILSTERRQQ